MAAVRDDRVRDLEHRSLAFNAGLVLAALVAMAGVAILTAHERRLSATLQYRLGEADRQARQEAALRRAAESLAGAYTMDEVTQRIVDAAVDALGGSGGLIERIAARAGDPSGTVVVQAVAGNGLPPVGAMYPLSASCTDLVSASGQPVLIEELGQAHCRSGGAFRLRGTGGSAIAVPLGGGDIPVGSLFVVGSSAGQFQPDAVERAGILGHLAHLAYEKIRLLDEAHTGRRHLEQVITSRSRLIRGFSHDVKNPIGAADGYAELLSSGVYGPLAPEQRVSIERLRGCLRGALSLIADLHDLGRAETGQLAITWEPVELAGLVRAMVEEYQAAAQAVGLSLRADTDREVPVVQADPERVRQIVSNLLSNAIKYTERGSVVVRTRHRPAASPSGDEEWVCVEVEDTGPGIPLDKQTMIFEEFTRLGTGDQEGAGLGLATSKLLARALGGHVSVQSEPGQGSRFTLWLPLHVPVQHAAARPPPGSGRSPSVSSRTFSGREVVPRVEPGGRTNGDCGVRAAARG